MFYQFKDFHSQVMYKLCVNNFQHLFYYKMTNIKIYDISVFIFTRDLRLHDNTALMHALQKSHLVLPVFIINPVQIKKSNKYRSDNCVQFMCECLVDLNNQLEKMGSKLFIFYDDPSKIIKHLIKMTNKISAIFMTKDYTPFAKERSSKINLICKSNNIIFEEYDDYLLTETVDTIKNTQGSSYVKFTPFLSAAKKHKVRQPIKNNYKNYVSKKVKLDKEMALFELKHFYSENSNIWVHGGRSNGIVVLKKIKRMAKTYSNTRDFPSESTTNLSAYLKFNVLSIREVYYEIKKYKIYKLMEQLYWRDFYMIIMDQNKVINTNMTGYNVKWRNMNTRSAQADFNLWKSGNTGFPLVDAGMRQLNETGYMHNRVRMIVASFLVKIMHIDWREGERYFASKLVDYDPANNNGGWQWVAGTGTDSQPYFRYLNPWSQSIKYDPKAKYIKTWIDELKNVPFEDIHSWEKSYINYKNSKLTYSKPIYDNVTSRVNESIESYIKAIRNKK